MIMDKTTQQLVKSIENNPNTVKEAIAEAAGIKGLALYNILKRLCKYGTITESEQDGGKAYCIGEIEAAINQGSNEEPDIISKGRYNSKFKFNGEEYGKEPLVYAVGSQYVADNKNTAKYNKRDFVASLYLIMESKLLKSSIKANG